MWLISPVILLLNLAIQPVQKDPHIIRLFLCGDVMTGRGIDQILPFPNDPVIHESYMRSAVGYVELAERVHGRIDYPVDMNYIWGDAFEYWDRFKPDLKIINLETSITSSNDYWKNKAVNYRMHPKNVPCLTEAGIDFCALGNNHAMDYGIDGLRETMQALKREKIAFAGCGLTLEEAVSPAIFKIPNKGRVIIFSMGTDHCGIPYSWAVSEDQPGVYMINDFHGTAMFIKQYVQYIEQPNDIVIVSIHWGGNWGYDIPKDHAIFARKLIDDSGVDVVHGHSSHHVKGIEIYKNRPILYGCGDFINDYEGIKGHEEYRDDLTLMYFLDMNASNGELIDIHLIPLRIKHFQLNKASDFDAKWMRNNLNREGKRLGTHLEIKEGNILGVKW